MSEKDRHGVVLRDPDDGIIDDEKFESFAFVAPGHEVAKTTVMRGHFGRPDDMRKTPSRLLKKKLAWRLSP
ncbi:MAG: hypothetical protein ABGX47_11660 [Martelella sp.]|uniref:hypothetical protein n=1 Tax=Martelella sp. TaxID=1969699 RepID=UPI003241E22F